MITGLKVHKPTTLQKTTTKYLTKARQKRLTDVFLLVGRRLTEAIQTSLVSLMVAVRKVEARNGQAGINQLFELFHLPTSWTQRAHNLGATVQHVGLFQNRVEGNVGTAKLGTARSNVGVAQGHDDDGWLVG